MQIDEEQFKKFILDGGLVSRVDFEDALEKAETKKQKVGNILLSEGKISETDLRRTEAFVLGIPFISLVDQKIDFSVLSLIPEPIARNYNIIAYKKEKNSLEVAMLDVDDLSVIDFIKKRSGLKILPRLTDTVSIRSVLVQYRQSLTAEFQNIIQKESTSLSTSSQKSGENFSEKSEQELKEMAEDLPVVKIVDSLLFHAILQNASDIHIEPGENELTVRYRIDGILHDAMVLDKNASSGITARIKVLSNLKLDEKRLPQDGRFKIEQNGEKISFRVSTLPVYFGEKIVMRLVRELISGFTLESLGFHGEALELLHKNLHRTNGMIITAGPADSGKSTTLYTMLDILNTPNVNISTIEDPIEYQMKRVNQTQVKSEIGLTFASGLRTLVHQDPDIIMIGEMRDDETANLAVNASLTGHLVFSALNTNSAASSISRLIEMKIEPFLIISTLNAVISQRLVRKLSTKKEKYYLSKTELDSLSKSVNLDKVLGILKEEKIVGKKDGWKNINFYRVCINASNVKRIS